MSDQFVTILHKRYAKLIELIINGHISYHWDSGNFSRAMFTSQTKKSTPTYFRYIRTLIDAGLLSAVDNKGTYKVNKEMLNEYIGFNLVKE